MPIQYPDILKLKTHELAYSWTDQDAMLYALGIGMGEDPLHEKELTFVSEEYLQVLPTFATVIAKDAGPRPSDLNRALVLDGGRDLTIHRPLASAASVVMNGRIVSVADKGAGKGAIITREVDILDASTKDKIATLVSTVFARGDGGFGGPKLTQSTDPAFPTDAPHQTVEITTRPNQALLYRLSGDRNPLHSDPQYAAKAGFARPILHGLCTYGICCRAVLQTYANFDVSVIRRFVARFSAPCFPGETLCVDLWIKRNTVSFRVRARDRDAVVIKDGWANLG